MPSLLSCVQLTKMRRGSQCLWACAFVSTNMFWSYCRFSIDTDMFTLHIFLKRKLIFLMRKLHFEQSPWFGMFVWFYCCRGVCSRVLPLHAQEGFAWHVNSLWCNSFITLFDNRLSCIVVLLMIIILFFTIYFSLSNMLLVLLKYIICCNMGKKRVLGDCMKYWCICDMEVPLLWHYGPWALSLSSHGWCCACEGHLCSFSVWRLADQIHRNTFDCPSKQESLLLKLESHVMCVNMRAMLPLAHVLSLSSLLLSLCRGFAITYTLSLSFLSLSPSLSLSDRLQPEWM